MRIRNAKGRKEGSGYARLFNNNKLGFLFSKAQATVIANGNELERIILSQSNLIKDLDDFIESIENNDNTYADGVYLCPKKILNKSSYNIPKIKPDILLFIVEKRRVCKVIELKDGDSFDTKKSLGEKESLEKFTKEFGSKVPFSTDYFICCFNQLDKNKIYEGFKGNFEVSHIMTGKELCEILNINYEQIIKERQRDAEDNTKYFIEELLKIEEIKNFIN